MTRDDIIRIALEAGGCTPAWDDFWELHEDALVRFAALVAAAEREACAKVCDETLRDEYLRQNRPVQDEVMLLAAIADCAAAIRARSET